MVFYFFFRSFNEGSKSIFNSYAGYYQLLPQILSLLILKISITFNPQITLFICTFIYAYIISLLMKPSYKWIHQNLLVRFSLVLSLTFILGITEILGNLCNLHSVLFLGVILRLMATFEEQYTISDYAFIFLASYSAGEIILVIPILLFRIYIGYKNKFENRILLSNWVLLIIIVVSTGIEYICYKKFETNAHSNANILALLDYLPSFFLAALNRLFYLPFLGNHKTIQLNHFFIDAIILGFFLLAGIFLALLRFRDSYLILVTVALMCYLGEILLTYLVRPGNITPPLGQMSLIWISRYMFMVCPVSLFFGAYFLKIALKIFILPLIFSII